MKRVLLSIAIAITVFLVGMWFSQFIIHNTHRGHHVSIFEAEVLPNELQVADAHRIRDMKAYDTIHVQEMGRDFAILTRTSDLTSYACSECHIAPLAEIQKKKSNGGQLAHWNVEIQHADADVMNCVTCHSPNNMDVLHTHTGTPVSFDQSYKVCMQCHQTQYKDWAGGAHGKKVEGWAKPVVKYTCVNCHNPHEPAFPHRMPARLNTRMIEQRAKK